MLFCITDEREDLRSVPDVNIAKLVQSVENRKMKNLSEVDLRPNTFKKIDEEGIYNPGKKSANIRSNRNTYLVIKKNMNTYYFKYCNLSIGTV